jgi:hypothetical protein
MPLEAMWQTTTLTRKFLQLATNEKLLLLKATFWLAIAAFVIAFLSFSHIRWLASRPLDARLSSRQRRLMEISRVRWAVVTCARWIPWRAQCFQQGLAAQLMLRGCRIATVLYYGAAMSETQGLSAHVWLCDGDVDVLGGENASGYGVLAMFSPPDKCIESPRRSVV